MLHVVLVRELLLEVYIRFGAGEHDLGVRGDASLRLVSNIRIPDAERVDGSNDNVQVSVDVAAIIVS